MTGIEPRTRRFALKAVGGVCLALPFGLMAREADARRVFCRTDPVVSLDGHVGSIYVSAMLDEWELNNSSGDILIEHPKDTATDKIWEDPNGYFGQGISTNFATNERLRKLASAMEIRVRCKIPASRDDMRIRLEWAPGPVTWDDDGNPLPNPVQVAVDGFANRWFGLNGTLPYQLAQRTTRRRRRSR